jgi:hypothetical protein
MTPVWLRKFFAPHAALISKHPFKIQEKDPFTGRGLSDPLINFNYVPVNVILITRPPENPPNH